MTNQRSSFRIEDDLDAELHFPGRVHPCRLVNLSAGGARVTTSTDLSGKLACELRIPLQGALSTAIGTDLVTLHMDVLDSTPEGSSHMVRMRSLDGPGTPEHELAAKLVSALQRRARARESGVEDASPMQTTAESIRRERQPQKLRISRRLWNPGSKRRPEE